MTYRLVICTIIDLDVPAGLQELRLPEFIENRRMNVIRLSAVLTNRLYPSPGHTNGTHFCWKLSRPLGHSGQKYSVNE